MLNDLRYALHLIAKDRWYSAVAVVALSLGIGVNATVFTLVDAVLIRGLPYKDSDRLYVLSSQRQNGQRDGVSAPDLADWRGQSRTFAALGAFDTNSVSVSDDRVAPENVSCGTLTANAFSIIAQRPLLGRDFTPADERAGAEPVVIIDAKLWKRRYAEDRGILGKTLRLDGKPATIIGVILTPRIAALPGAEAASFTTSVPPSGPWPHGIEIDGRTPRPDERLPEAAVVAIGPDFFRTVGVQLLRRRDFSDSDGMPVSETVIVSARFAAQRFPGEDPIGRRLRLAPWPGQAPPATPPVWRTIVGISPDIRHGNPQATDPPAAIYVPQRQDPPTFVTLLVRSHLDAGAVMNAVRGEVAALDPDQPVFTARTMKDMLARATWPYRVFGTLFAIFALIALAMPSVGLYAVMAYSVAQRTPEIGVRMALGAGARQVSWLVLRRGLVQTGVGLTLGLIAAFFLARVMRTLLVQIGPDDPVTFASITVVLCTVALCACLVPAHRATLVDPLVALRTE